jgi:hypothetical protein
VRPDAKTVNGVQLQEEECIHGKLVSSTVTGLGAAAFAHSTAAIKSATGRSAARGYR